MAITKAQARVFEQFLARFVNPDTKTPIKDGGLSWGFGRNALIFKKAFRQIREELSLVPYSENMKKYDEMVNKWISEHAGDTVENLTAYSDSLKDELGVREEFTERSEKIKEILDEEVDVELYRISRQKVSGMRDGDDPSKCVLSSEDSAYLQDLGVLYDPEDETPVKE